MWNRFITDQRWKRFVEPAASVQTEPDRYEAQFLAAFFLLAALGNLLNTLFRYLIDPVNGVTLLMLAAVMASSAILLIGYGLARQGQTRLAERIMIWIMTGLILLLAVVSTDDRGLNMLNYLIVPILFACLFTTFQLTLAAVIVSISGMFAVAYQTPYIDVNMIIRGPVQFVLVVAMIGGVFAYYRSRMEFLRQGRLRENEEGYRIVSELISDYAFRFRVEPDGSKVNEWTAGSFAKVSGYEWSELESKGVEAIIEPEDRDRLEQDIEQTIQGHTISGEYRMHHRLGDIRWIRIDRKPIRDTSGTTTHYYSVVQDITARKQAEERQMMLALQHEWVRLMGRFVLAVSHDFRNVLTRIENSAYLLQRALEMGKPERTSERIHGIQEGVQHMVRQLDTLLMVSALTNLSRHTCYVNTLVSDLLEQFTAEAHSKNQLLVFAPNPFTPNIQGDGPQITNALRHLLVNALHHTPPGGTITVRTHPGQQSARIEIRDTGPGIETEHLHRIFDLFYRVDTARPLTHGGVGLGLSIALMIAEAHGGSIQVESEVGNGTAFFLTLPINSSIKD